MINSLLKSTWAVVLIIIAIGFVTHSAILSGPFKVMDDEISIVYNEQIRSFTHLGEIFKSSFFGGNSYYRPLVTVSFLLEYQFFKLNPFYYNLTNLLLHLGTAIVLFLFLSLFYQRRDLSFFVALLFAIHPIHWEAVSNIAGRSILLCGFFYVLSIYYYARARLHEESSSYWKSILVFVCSMLSKEVGVTIPIVLVCYEFFVNPLENTNVLSRSTKRGLAPYFALALVYFFIRQSLNITNVFKWDSILELLLGIVTFVRISFVYLRAMIFPYDLHFDRSYAYFQSLTQPGAMLSIFFAFIVVTGLLVFRQRIKGVNKFFMSWVFIILLPTSQIVPIRAHGNFAAAAEHFLYLPAIGLLFLYVTFADLLFEKAKEKRMMSKWSQFIIVSFFLVFFIILSNVQNRVSAHPVNMFAQSIQYNPTNTRVRTSYALALASIRDFQGAEKQFRQVLEAEPFNDRARIGLGKSLCDQKKCWEAILEYEKVSSTASPDLLALVKNNLQLTYKIAIAQYEYQLIGRPYDYDIHFSLGVVHTKAGNTERAIKHYEKAIDLNPEHKNALFNLASLCESIDQKDKALKYFQHIVTLDVEDYMKSYAESRIIKLSH